MENIFGCYNKVKTHKKKSCKTTTEFENLPEYSKLGLFYSNHFNKLRKQKFKVKKIAFENLKYIALKKLKNQNFAEAVDLFSRVKF